MEKKDDNGLYRVYETLLAHYGDLKWWPADTPYEVIVGAVLAQNTAWSNVEKAIANFGDSLSPEAVRDMDPAKLIEIIRPSGFFNQKAGYLKNVTEWFSGYGFNAEVARREPLEKIRAELLGVKGVGRETADAILLYAIGLPSYVVDAYTVRLCGRYPIDAGEGYEKIKAYFEENLPADAGVYNRFHAMIDINAKEYCRKKPECAGCPLEGGCAKKGI
ncbi:MAG: endonuclease [Clostridiales bacterium]|nr:endonuclease [Clostridiales bacterium]